MLSRRTQMCGGPGRISFPASAARTLECRTESAQDQDRSPTTRPDELSSALAQIISAIVSISLLPARFFLIFWVPAIP